MKTGTSGKSNKALELISKINGIIKINNKLEITLQKIVDTISTSSNNQNIGIRIVYNNNNYVSVGFSNKDLCYESTVKTTFGNKAILQISSNRNCALFIDFNPANHENIINKLASIIIEHVNEYDTIPNTCLINENNTNRPVSRKLLQRFLNNNTYNRDIYHDLMPFKVKEILLISSLYDAYSIESEGKFSEHMLGQYGQLNLTSFPRITGASNLNQALDLLKNKHFELIVYMVGVDKQAPIDVISKIKTEYPYIPVYLLLNNSADVAYFTERKHDLSFIDNLFTWDGDSNIIFSMIKLLEDKINIENDTQLGEVRVILLVEDSPKYYSRYLSFLYKVLMEQTKRIIDDVSTDELYKVLRMRARPKIIHATNYEQAVEIITKYQKYLICLITDIKYEKDGEFNENAGIELLKYTKSKIKNIPVILQSSDSTFDEIAKKNNALFIHKHSDTVYHDFEHFITNYLGFGDFVFKDGEGNTIAIASNMKEFETFLKKIPDSSLIYHGKRDHFSMWLMARGEIKAASIISVKKVDDYENPIQLRAELLKMLKHYRNEAKAGSVISFKHDKEITEENIYTLASGSLGGKGRGLAFIDALIQNFNFAKHIPDVKVRTPKTLIIGTQEFETFLKFNKLKTANLIKLDYESIKIKFLDGKLSDSLHHDLYNVLKAITKPIAVRSSGILEDSLTQPFAGIFETYLLPNNNNDINIRIEQAENAIKLVMASVFSNTAKGYVKAINLKIEEEKMAVIIQEVVGNKYDSLFYPHLSGVAQSYNFYPFSHMKPEEGFAIAGVGLGRYVVEGNKAYRFSPKYPSTEINSTKDQVKNSQVVFYAVDLAKEKLNFLEGELAGLTECNITTAEKHGTLKHLASVYNPDSNTIYPGTTKQGPRIVNFANILKYNYISLAKTIDLVLKLGKDAMGSPIEIEYAVDLTKDDDGKASFYILQIKPLITSSNKCNINMDTINKDSIILFSEKGMGNGHINNITDIIYIDEDRFNKAETEEMAKEIEEINNKMIDLNRKYILIGPGRWGTRDRWIGIPVKWHMISNAKVIVETSFDNFPLDASSGSHFFHNVTSMNVGYFTVQPELLNSYIIYNKLKSQKVIQKGKYFNHVKFDNPLEIKMDGKKRIYLIHEQ